MMNPTTLDLAVFGSALEKMIHSTAIHADLDIALEKTIGRRVPSFFDAFCGKIASVSENMT